MAGLFRLFGSFVLIALGAYGGGLVTIPLIQHEIVEKHNWLGFEEMAGLVAIAQITPGPIAINSATFVGFRLGSFLGSLTATVAVVLPSLTILTALTPFLEKVQTSSHVLKIRQGLQMGVLSLIIFAVWSYGTAVMNGIPEIMTGIAAFAFLVAFEGKIHPFLVILGSGLLGICIF